MNRKAKESRRDFLKDVAVLSAAAAVVGAGLPGRAAETAPDLVVASGDDPKAMVKKVVAELGGMKRFVSRGDVVVVKPNIGWEKSPEWAANTHPDVVVALIEMALDAGAKEVKVFDRSVRPAPKCYAGSGIEEAAKKAGARVLHVTDLAVADLAVPKGRHLKKSSVYKDAIECDCFINVPVAKHHVRSRLTLCMKNHMGITADDRGGVWHPQLDQVLADFASAFAPKLNVLDAYRIVVDKGPNTGSLDFVKLTKKCIAGVNQASVDAYATVKLFDLPLEQVRHIALARELGVGEVDLAKLQIRDVTA